MAEVIPAAEFSGFQPDFLKVNAILASVVPWVETRLSLILPLLVFVNKYLANVESLIINFNLDQARQNAWNLAERLLRLDPADREPGNRPGQYASGPPFAFRSPPGLILSAAEKVIRVTEIGTVRSTIDDLRNKAVASRKRQETARLTRHQNDARADASSS